jgi:hypothetical protein
VSHEALVFAPAKVLNLTSQRGRSYRRGDFVKVLL